MILRRTRFPGNSLVPVWSSRIDCPPTGLEWTADGNYLAVVQNDGSISIFDSNTGISIVSLQGHGMGAAAITWRPGTHTLASAGWNGKVRILDLDATGEICLEGGAPWCNHAAWAPSGRYLATAAYRTLRIWSCSGDLVQEHITQNGPISAIAWHPVNDELMLASGGILSLRSALSSSTLEECSWDRSPSEIRWSPDGRALGTSDPDGKLQFYFRVPGTRQKLGPFPAKVCQLAWSSTSEFLATGGSATICVWDCRNDNPIGDRPLLLNFHDSLIESVAFQHRGTLFTAGCAGGTVSLWQIGGDLRPIGIGCLEHGVVKLAWSPRDDLVAAVDRAGTVQVFGSIL